MTHKFKKIILPLSLAINLFVALPAIVLLAKSNSIQYDLYQTILAPRFGRPEIVFIGDSITRGGGIWAFRIGRYNFNVWNYGHGGLTTRQIQHYAKIVVKQKKTRYAFVMAGINDPEKTVDGAEKSFKDYKVIIDTLLEGGVMPIIQLTLYRESEKSPEYIDRLNELLTSYSKRKGITVIDMNPILAPEKSLLPRYSADGVHLTEHAYQIWSEKVKDVLAAMAQNRLRDGD
jgi:hypothetical protein